MRTASVAISSSLAYSAPVDPFGTDCAFGVTAVAEMARLVTVL